MLSPVAFSETAGESSFFCVPACPCGLVVGGLCAGREKGGRTVPGRYLPGSPGIPMRVAFRAIRSPMLRAPNLCDTSRLQIEVLQAEIRKAPVMKVKRLTPPKKG